MSQWSSLFWYLGRGMTLLGSCEFPCWPQHQLLLNYREIVNTHTHTHRNTGIYAVPPLDCILRSLFLFFFQRDCLVQLVCRIRYPLFPLFPFPFCFPLPLYLFVCPDMSIDANPPPRLLLTLDDFCLSSVNAPYLLSSFLPMLVLVLKGVLVTVLLVSFSMTAILTDLGSACPLSGLNLLSSNPHCEITNAFGSQWNWAPDTKLPVNLKRISCWWGWCAFSSRLIVVSICLLLLLLLLLQSNSCVVWLLLLF